MFGKDYSLSSGSAQRRSNNGLTFAQRIKCMSVLDWILTVFMTVAAILMVLWIGNYWLFLLVPLAADVYSTRYVPWGFWKRRKDGKKPSAVVEWIDAIVFAVVAVYFINLFFFQNYKIPTSSLEKSLLVGDHLFVSKVKYGPRMPNAPLFLPMTQHTLPFTESVKSYLDWPLWPYKRLAGVDSIRRNDIVVFNFPAGDTVCLAMQNPSYYEILLLRGGNTLTPSEREAARNMKSAWDRNHFISEKGRKSINTPGNPLGNIVTRPVDKRECYVKRCIGLPGDYLAIRHNAVYINDRHLKDMPDVQHNYAVTTTGLALNDRFYDNYGIAMDDRPNRGAGSFYILPLTRQKAESIAALDAIKSVEIEDIEPDSLGTSVYPWSPDYPWSRDNYGPVWIPRRGATIHLDEKNALLYERAICAYEGHSLDVRGGKVFLDGKETDSYTFEMNYYFMLGDNRHKSADSRYWGFVPEDHVIGKPLFVWLSLDPDKSFFGSIRWNRFFKTDFDRTLAPEEQFNDE